MNARALRYVAAGFALLGMSGCVAYPGYYDGGGAGYGYGRPAYSYGGYRSGEWERGNGRRGDGENWRRSGGGEHMR